MTFHFDKTGYASRQKATPMNGCDIFDNCAQCPIPFCPGSDDDLLELDEMDEDDDDGW